MATLSGKTFSRRAPDIITEELVAAFQGRASFEFKPLFEHVFGNLRARNAASGGEEMLRLRCYEKLQGLVERGAVKKTVNGVSKKYKGVSAPLALLDAEMEQVRSDWAERTANARTAAAAAAL
jgi:hypothetical protein